MVVEVVAEFAGFGTLVRTGCARLVAGLAGSRGRGFQPFGFRESCEVSGIGKLEIYCF